MRVDSDAIFRVLTNLLSNARKYSPSGGSIVVGAAVVSDMIEVYVQDDGLGIPAPYQLRDLIAFTLLIMVLIFRPQGLLGARMAKQRA